jgi:hypothetical protein
MTSAPTRLLFFNLCGPRSQSTPTLVIGDQVLIGFEPEKIEAALNESSTNTDPSPANQTK